ncbi:hypothetical protein RM553_08305 [Zunongwangia sp. F363]|uniref:Uncharacterized protein n=1 Tax=Autumnicola tepida TaxID=3075595 RepID=A0ABU3C911_9FLAO|nr:hypothetical protein [Zunongwangia sp. F363]MDT0642830.1 hypothetical protein [Zunongwangia sp. F363]
MKKKKLLKKIIDLIIAKYDVHSVYLLGSRKEKEVQKLKLEPTVLNNNSGYTFLLFIIFRGIYKINEKKIQKFLLKNNYPEYVICPIVYNLSEFLRQIDRGSTFLGQIQANISPFYSIDTSIKDLKLEPSHYLVFWKRKTSEWKIRSKRACFLLLKAEEYDGSDIDSAAKMSILHDCLQQLCLGLLVVCWDFKPKILQLKYLLHLCSYYISLLKENETARLTMNAYHLLLDAHEIMQQNTEIKIQEEESEQAAALCSDFLREAHVIAKNELNRYHQKCLDYENKRRKELAH